MTTTPHDGLCHPYEHLPGCDCFDNPQERNPIQSPLRAEVQSLEAQRDELLIAARFVFGCLQQERAWRSPDLNQAMIALGDAIALAEAQ